MKSMFWKELLWLLVYTLGGFVLTLVITAVAIYLSGHALGGEQAGMTVRTMHVMQWAQTLFVMALPPLLWAKFYLHEPVANALNLWKPRWEWLLLTFCLMVAILPLMDTLTSWTEAMPLPDALREHAEAERLTNDRLMQQMLSVDGFGGWLELILLLSLGTAIGEEFMFRGGLLRCFRYTKLSHVSVAVLIGLIFALIHFDLQGLIVRWLLGTILVLLTQWSGSIWPAVLAHALNNLGALVMMKVYGPEQSYTDWPWSIVLCSILFTIALIYIMYKRRVASQA